MKRGSIIVVSAAVLLIALGGLGFAVRGTLRDAWYEARTPDIPAAVPIQETAAARQATTSPTTANANRPAPVANANINRPVANANVAPAPAPAPTPTPTPSPAPAPSIPSSYNLAVPWTIQAPFANWTDNYEDGCEEASALMVHYYYSNQAFDSEQESKDELDKLFAWEDDRYGYNHDTTTAETATTLREYFGYEDVEVVENPTAARIKQEIAAGYPVIIPAYGKALLNPNFRNGGPDYHMLVIKGYTADTFITNDPGTRRGADYVYPISRIMDAIHDWNGGDVAHGRKVMIVVRP